MALRMAKVAGERDRERLGKARVRGLGPARDPDVGEDLAGLRGYTRAHRYSSPAFLVTTGTLRIKETGGGQ